MFFLFLALKSAISQQAVLDINQVLSIGWTFNQENITLFLTVIFTQCNLNQQGWCGIGFGLSMQQTDMILISHFYDRIAAVDLYSTGYWIPPVDDTLGGSSDWTLISSELLQQGGFQVEINRKLNTKDKYDSVLYQDIVSDFCYAYIQAEYFAFHRDNYGFGQIKFAAEQSEAYFQEYRRYGDLYLHHGLWMTTIWLGMVPVAVFTARYFKWVSYWFFIHACIGVATVSLTLYIAQQIYRENSSVDYAIYDEYRVHSKLGIGISTLVVAQGVLGVLTTVLKLRETSLSILMATRRLHRITGFSLLISSIFSVNLGWKIYGQNQEIILCIYLSVIVLFSIFQFRHQFRFLLPVLKFQSSVALRQELPLRQQISNYVYLTDKIQRKRKQWVFCDQWLLDVSDWMNHHPGSRKIIKKIIGMDAGKYIYGSSSIIPNLNPFQHPHTTETIIDGLIIGKVGFATQILRPVEDQSYQSMKWSYLTKFNLCESTFCLQFFSSKWQICKPEGVEWLGKHFLVGGLLTKRYYSFVYTNMEQWRKELKEKGYWIEREPIDIETHTLNLYVKPYALGKISTYLTSLSTGDQVRFKGPMGPGLLIDHIPNSSTLAFAAGTGLLPFIDLLYYIWTEEIPLKFKLNLYLTFSTKGDVFGLDLALAVQQKYPKQVRVWVNVSKDKDNYDGVMSQEKLEQWVDLAQVQKTWVCGPSGFNLWIQSMMVASGYPKEKIVLL